MTLYSVGPGFHVLSKVAGNPLSQGWAAINSGGTVGNAFIRLRNMSLPNIAIISAGPPTPVAPGATVILRNDINTLAGGNFVAGANSMRLEMVSVDEGLVVGTHDYTINFGAPPPPPGPNIDPVGDPSII